MKKVYFLISASLLSLTLATAAFSDNSLVKSLQDFIAPTVYDITGLDSSEHELGKMVYDVTTDTFYGNTGTGFRNLGATAADLAPKVAIVKEVQSSGHGGTSVSGIQTRVLNTIEGDNSFVSLSSNKFTLDAGVYLIEADAPAYYPDQHRVILYNEDTSSNQATGANAYSGGATTLQHRATLTTYLTLATQTEFSLRHYILNPIATSGLGHQVSDGNDQVYSQVKIIKFQ